MSVAPEIARLAKTVLLAPAAPGVTSAPPRDLADHAAAQLTLGTLARRLRSIAATPERWWGLVRFEPDRSVQIMVEECAAYQAWLVVLPPGDAGHACDCDVATMIAGEAAEGTPGRAARAVRRVPAPARAARPGHRIFNQSPCPCTSDGHKEVIG